MDQPSCESCSSISSRAASSADRRCGLLVRSDRMRSRCSFKPCSLRCRSRSSIRFISADAGVCSTARSGTSTSSFSQPRAMSRFYAFEMKLSPLPYNLRVILSPGAPWWSVVCRRTAWIGEQNQTRITGRLRRLNRLYRNGNREIEPPCGSFVLLFDARTPLS